MTNIWDKKFIVTISVSLAIIIALSGVIIYLTLFESCEEKPVPTSTPCPHNLETDNRMNKKYLKEPGHCREASILTYPSVGAIIDRVTLVDICAGAVLSSAWMITAAHCLHNCSMKKCPEYLIRTGTSNVASKSGQTNTIGKIILHKLFDPKTLDNDLGMVKMAKNFTFDSFCHEAAIGYAYPPSGHGAILGWTSYAHVDVPYRSHEFQILNLSIESASVCQDRLKHIDSLVQFTDNMICTLFGVESAGCQIASGSPFFMGSGLIGIGTFQQRCFDCKYHMYVITKLEKYQDFYSQVLKM